MILREWHGRAAHTNPDAYPRHFCQTVLPELRGTPGFRGASLSRRDLPGKIEFLVLTRWESMDAIGAFAGASVEKAVVEPGAVAALIDYDELVTHYTVIEEVPDPSPVGAKP